MRTIGDVFDAIFPRGTKWPEIARLEPQEGEPDFTHEAPPCWPPDVFALTAKLVELSGAYHHVAPETKAPSRARARTSRLAISQAEREQAVGVAAEWRRILREEQKRLEFLPPPTEVTDRWNKLRAAVEEEIFVEISEERIPSWWAHAFFLLMVADEASQGIGFESSGRPAGEPKAMLDIFLDIFRFNPGGSGGAPGSGGGAARLSAWDYAYSCSFANRNVICVLPKSRTPSVGCTPRSLTHNLAALPPAGEVKVQWVSPPRAESPLEIGPLKILVIPYPYHLDAACFGPIDDAAVDASVDPWGWFHIRPLWLGQEKHEEMLVRARQFADFVVNLVNEATSDGEPVNSIVFPEAALNEIFFGAVMERVLRNCPGVETLISGITERPSASGMRPGNFVTQCMFIPEAGQRNVIRSWREKHHRWRVERSQIEVYGLRNRLDPCLLWWEGIEITSRSLDVFVFRPGATMTALICEDLARVDPCQAAVRAIGPTLVIALLMDGSQLAIRWPARYATVLAEDPGSAVLTVSSLGLINRTRLRDGSRPKWSVALWRDDLAGPTEILLQPGYHAVAMTLRPDWRTEATLDGRHDRRRALAWRLDMDDTALNRQGPRSIRASGEVPDWIVEGTR